MISKKVIVFLHTSVCFLLLLHLDAIDAVHQRATESRYNTSEFFNTSALLENFGDGNDSKNGFENTKEGLRKEYREALANIAKQKIAGSITKEEADTLKELAKKIFDEKNAAQTEENKADEVYHDNSESFNNTSGFLQEVIEYNDNKNGVENTQEGIRKEYREAKANIKKQEKAGTITKEEADSLKELAKETFDEKKVALREEKKTDEVYHDNSESLNNLSGLLQEVIENNDNKNGVENTKEDIREEFHEAKENIKKQEKAGTITKEEAKALKELVKKIFDEKKAALPEVTKEEKKEYREAMKETKKKIKKEYMETLANIKEQKKAGRVPEEEAESSTQLAKKTKNEKIGAMRENIKNSGN